MTQQKLPNWIWLSFVLAFCSAFPVQTSMAQERTLSKLPITKISRVSEIARPATTLKEWLSQTPAPNSQSQSPTLIINVQLKSTDDGLDVILKTATDETLQGSITSQGNNLIIDIPNAQLQLPEGEEFRQENPIEGIATITLTTLNTNSVRLIISGIDGKPTGKLNPSQQGLTLSLIPPEADIEIIVTAEKQPENIQDVPISITALTEQEIEDADITSLGGISANTPNFATFGSTRNFIQYSIRGLSNFNFLSRDPVAFYVDDVPYDYTGFLDIDLPDIERVEVLRGPQSTLYGRNALAGVVNIITRKPTNDFEFIGSALYGNFDNVDLRASVSGPIVEDKLLFRVSGSYESQEGFLENTFLDTDVDSRLAVTGRAQLLWTPTEDLEISFNTSVDDYQDGALPLVFLEQSDPFEIEQNFNGFSNLNSNTQALKVIYSHPRFRLTSITSRRFSDQEFENEADVTIADLLTQVGEVDSTVISQEIRLQSPAESEQFQWLVGSYFESRDFNVDADGFRFGADAVALFGSTPGLNIIRADINETTLAVFAQASYKPIDALTLTAGVRYESFNSLLESRESIFIPADGSPSFPSGASFSDIEQGRDIFLPRFVLQYRFNPNLMVYGSVARGYRPPGVNYRAETLELLTFDAERSLSYEVGLKSSWLDDRLIINAAVFYNPVDDFQVAVPNATGLFQDIANAEVTIAGFEIEARATPLNGLDIIAGLGFIEAEFTDYTNPFTGQVFDGNRPAYAPDFTYNLAVQYRATFGFFARLELQGLGTTFLDDANIFRQGPVAFVNTRLGYEFGNYGIFFFANNIFGTERLNSAVAFPPFGNLVTVSAPTTFGVQLRARI